jgi:2-keto-4-pentenoate hydratase/2-oxohepta-3-ene-1,7-dioic acid hydratase in catechol pathway
MHDKQFTRGKSFDTFAPSGPWITSVDEVTDPQDLRLTTKVNGYVRQDSSTKNMFIKIPSIISKLSKVMTLEKGDIIATGTPEGVALNNPDIPFLKDGDEIEMGIEKLGKIKNTVRFTD